MELIIAGRAIGDGVLEDVAADLTTASAVESRAPCIATLTEFARLNSNAAPAAPISGTNGERECDHDVAALRPNMACRVARKPEIFVFIEVPRCSNLSSARSGRSFSQLNWAALAKTAARNERW